MGVKESVQSNGRNGRASLLSLCGRKGCNKASCSCEFWQDNRRLVFELKSLVIIMGAVISQHMNLFDLHVEDYNLKLIAYIFLVLSLRTARLASRAFDGHFLLQAPGLRDFLRFYRVFCALAAGYLFCTMYESPTLLKLLFLVY